MTDEKPMISRRGLLASGMAALSAGAANLLQRNPLLAAAQRAGHTQRLHPGGDPQRLHPALALGGRL